MNSLTDLQKHFINLRFGTFIHFNSATFQFCKGEVTDWEYAHENSGEPRRYPFHEEEWNPVGLDCRQWASVAKSAGCRYAALTAKHHEGFCLWLSGREIRGVGILGTSERPHVWRLVCPLHV
ncbi:MAG TPA: hypothetical protein DCZ91_05510 [Lachnospiraceae bacterium]|nr:hypothetical protein [Lachnospiraceae bacterium]